MQYKIIKIAIRVLKIHVVFYTGTIEFNEGAKNSKPSKTLTQTLNANLFSD